MKKISLGAFLAATTVLAGGFASAQDTISTLSGANGGGLAPWGLPNTAAYGQSFAVASDASLNSATFRIDDRGSSISYDLHVLRWNGSSATSGSIGSASGATAGVNGFAAVTTNTGGISLEAGEYIVILQATSTGSSQWEYSSTAYADGGFVYQNNGGDTSQLATGFWASSSQDFAFEFIFGPATSGIDRLTAASGTAARLIVIGAEGVARDAGQVSIAARNDRIELTRVADGTGAGDVTVSTSGIPGMMGNLYTWAEVTGFRSDEFGSGTGTIGGGGLQIGADMEIGADMVAGVSIGFSQINAEDAGTTTEGSYTYLQPYFAYRSGAWHGSASLIFGAGGFEQNGGADTADVTLAAATFEGGRDYALSPAFTITPTIGLLHGREEIDGTGGALAGTSSDTQFSQLSLGGRLTHTGAGGTLFGGLHADYLTSGASSVLAEDLLADNGWTGRVEVGGEMALSNGMDLSTSVELSGLGGMETVSGGLNIALRF